MGRVGLNSGQKVTVSRIQSIALRNKSVGLRGKSVASRTQSIALSAKSIVLGTESIETLSQSNVHTETKGAHYVTKGPSQQCRYRMSAQSTVGCSSKFQVPCSVRTTLANSRFADGPRPAPLVLWRHYVTPSAMCWYRNNDIGGAERDRVSGHISSLWRPPPTRSLNSLLRPLAWSRLRRGTQQTQVSYTNTTVNEATTTHTHTITVLTIVTRVIHVISHTHTH